jgi:hypothetical protein
MDPILPPAPRLRPGSTHGKLRSALKALAFELNDAISGVSNGRAAMTADALPPADWYEDPAGTPQMRYWDGQQWTHHYAPAGVTPLLQKRGRTPSRALGVIVGAVLVLFSFGGFSNVASYYYRDGVVTVDVVPLLIDLIIPVTILAVGLLLLTRAFRAGR